MEQKSKSVKQAYGYTVKVYQGRKLIKSVELGDITHSDADGVAMAYEMQGFKVKLIENFE